MRKKERERFIKKATQLLLTIGAKQQEDGLILQTQAGILTIHVRENITDGPGTVFARFDDAKAARLLVGCNQLSGKWNHHYFAGWTVETALLDLSYQMKTVMAKKISPSVSA